MNRDRWLLLISVVIFVGLGVRYWRSGWLVLPAWKRSVGAPIQSLPPGGAEVEEAGQERPDPVVPSGVLGEEGEWGRNPFLTTAEAARGGESADSEFKIRAIVMGPPRSVATLDGQTVMVGEKVGKETVVEIHSDTVILEKDGHKRILKIKEPSISIEVKERKR